MIFLIDYDNLPRSLMKADLRQLIEILVSKLESSIAASVNRISCRLYGGWLNRKSLSLKADRLLQEIYQHFPLALSLTDGTGIIAIAELARSLACDPKHDFTHTFRTRSKPAFNVKRFPLKECIEPLNCRITDENSGPVRMDRNMKIALSFIRMFIRATAVDKNAARKRIGKQVNYF